MRAVLLAVALIAPLAAATPGAPLVPHEPPWWEATAMDADGDRIDDALAAHDAAAATLLVSYAANPTRAQLDALHRAGFLVERAYEHFPLLAVRASPADAPRLLALPGVVFVEADAPLWPLLRESVPLVGAPQAWATYGATGRGVTVAVLDDGAFSQHPDFEGRIVARHDAAAPAGAGALVAGLVPRVGPDGHATHVAGTIAGSGAQSRGVYKGVAPDAALVDVQVFRAPNETSSSIVLAGLDWVLSNGERYGIRVASVSLGGKPSDGTDAVSRGVDRAVERGLVVVAAAGNIGPGPGTITAPGAAEKAITVGAVDKSKRVASYSSRGPTSDGRTKPDLVAPGTTIVSTLPPVTSSAPLAILGGGAETLFYGARSGTSMAAPHVAGVVALMLEANSDLAPDEVRRILLATAQDLGESGPDDATGFGFVNAVAAVQVARDPDILQAAQFEGVLAEIPDASSASGWSVLSGGRLALVVALAVAALAGGVIAGVAFARRGR